MRRGGREEGGGGGGSGERKQSNQRQQSKWGTPYLAGFWPTKIQKFENWPLRARSLRFEHLPPHSIKQQMEYKYNGLLMYDNVQLCRCYPVSKELISIESNKSSVFFFVKRGILTLRKNG